MCLRTCSVCFHVSVIAWPIVPAVNTICLPPSNEENSQLREPKCLSNRLTDQGTYLCFTDPGGIQFFPFTQSILIQAPLVPQLNFDRKKKAS